MSFTAHRTDRWWRLVLVWAIAVLLAWVTAVVSLDREPPPTRIHLRARTAVEALSTWDGEHYGAVASVGYSTEGDAIRLFNFFPLYPALSRLLGGKGHANLAGIFLSQVLTLGSLILMSLLAHGARRGRLVEEPGVWLLLNPFSFFLLTFYAESLFLFLTLLHVAAYRWHRSSASAAAGLLAGLKRFLGSASTISTPAARTRSIRQPSRAIIGIAGRDA